MTKVGVDLKFDVGLDSEEPRRIAEQFERFGAENGLPERTIFGFQLALDEILTNVISYGFEEDTRDPIITVTLHLTDTEVEAVIQDNGIPFNPLDDAAEPDVDLPAPGRPIGGLGIHLTKAFVHKLTYERVDGCNRLNLVQPLETPEDDA
jgi:anti-sigma regulatory factor (Ser/Thr protein kinase)